MDLDQARSFATSNHRAVLATRTRDGGVQQSPVLVGVGERGRFTVSSRETAFKTKNLRRDPWVQLCIFPDGFFGEWIIVEGRVTVLSLPEAMEPLVTSPLSASIRTGTSLLTAGVTPAGLHGLQEQLRLIPSPEAEDCLRHDSPSVLGGPDVLSYLRDPGCKEKK